MVEIGLFPLGLVLVPGERAPLHIFEERYKELIGECLETGAEFGLVLTEETGPREVGTRASVVLVLERFDDGRLNVVIEGRERFRILALTEGRSFATARVEPVTDLGAEQPTEQERAACLEAYGQLMAAVQAEPDDLDLETGTLAFQVAGRVEFGVALKQELLEIRSEREGWPGSPSSWRARSSSSSFAGWPGNGRAATGTSMSGDKRDSACARRYSSTRGSNRPGPTHRSSRFSQLMYS
jgi:Lon protease-like protein